MGQSNAQARRKAAADRDAKGIVLDKSGKEKKAANEMINCTMCSQQLRVTKKNVELKMHWESKHPKQNDVCPSNKTNTPHHHTTSPQFTVCFPGQTYEGM